MTSCYGLLGPGIWPLCCMLLYCMGVMCSNPGGGTSQYKLGLRLLDDFLFRSPRSRDLDLLLSSLSLSLLLSLSRSRLLDLSLSLLRDLFSLFTLSSPILHKILSCRSESSNI